MFFKTILVRPSVRPGWSGGVRPSIPGGRLSRHCLAKLLEDFLLEFTNYPSDCLLTDLYAISVFSGNASGSCLLCDTVQYVFRIVFGQFSERIFENIDLTFGQGFDQGFGSGKNNKHTVQYCPA